MTDINPTLSVLRMLSLASTDNAGMFPTGGREVLIQALATGQKIVADEIDLQEQFARRWGLPPQEAVERLRREVFLPPIPPSVIDDLGVSWGLQYTYDIAADEPGTPRTGETFTFVGSVNHYPDSVVFWSYLMIHGQGADPAIISIPMVITLTAAGISMPNRGSFPEQFAHLLDDAMASAAMGVMLTHYALRSEGRHLMPGTGGPIVVTDDLKIQPETFSILSVNPADA